MSSESPDDGANEPIAVELPATAAVVGLLARRDAAATHELATALLALLDSAFFRAVVDVRFTIRTIDLHGASPSFPGAVVIGDGLDPSAEGQAGTDTVDRETFLATPVILAEGRLWTAQEVLALAAAPVAGSLAQAWLAIELTVRAIARVVLDAVHSLDPAIEESRPLLVHHSAPDGASVFVAREAALNSPGIDAPLEGGFSWAMAARLVRPRVPRHRVVYEVGDVAPSALLFSVWVSKDGALRVLCRPGAGSVLEVATRADALFERFVKLIAVVRFTPFCRLSLWIDDVLVGSARGDASSITRLVGRQSIGGGVLGRRRSALFYRELVVLGAPAGATTRGRLSRRLGRHASR